jgi:dTDP-4-dehydrorhamnose reductase
MRVLVTGGSGYLGRELLNRHPDAVGTVHRSEGDLRLDVRDATAVARLIAAVGPACVIHTAYARDGAGAWETNVEGARNVAVAAAAARARLVHLSTDVVFGGDAGRPYVESDLPDPVTDYGRSKAAAEAAVLGAHPGAAVVRTSLIYGGETPSPIERAAMDAVDGTLDMAFFTDEIRCPVHVADLSEAILELARIEFSGLLHVAGSDAVSRYDLARLVAAATGRDPGLVRGESSRTSETMRPLDCRLDCGLARSVLATRVRGVRDVLQGPSRETAQAPSALV